MGSTPTVHPIEYALATVLLRRSESAPPIASWLCDRLLGRCFGFWCLDRFFSRCIKIFLIFCILLDRMDCFIERRRCVFFCRLSGCGTHIASIAQLDLYRETTTRASGGLVVCNDVNEISRRLQRPSSGMSQRRLLLHLRGRLR